MCVVGCRAAGCTSHRSVKLGRADAAQHSVVHALVRTGVQRVREGAWERHAPMPGRVCRMSVRARPHSGFALQPSSCYFHSG